MLDSFQNQIDLSPPHDGLGYFCRLPANLHLHYTIFLNNNCQLFVNSRANTSIMSTNLPFLGAYLVRNIVSVH